MYGGKLVEWAKLVGGWSLELVRRSFNLQFSEEALEGV